MRFGMSDKLGPRVFGHDHGMPFLGREFSSEPDYSDEIAREIDDEIRRIVESAHQQAKDILAEHREMLTTISEILLKRETIESEEFEALLAGKTEEEVFGPDDAPAGGTPERPSSRPPAAERAAPRRSRAPASPAAPPRPAASTCPRSPSSRRSPDFARRAAVLLGALLVAGAIGPGHAAASTVTFTPGEVDTISNDPDTPDGVGGCSKYGMCAPSLVRIAGDPGEANNFVVTADGASVIVRDAGAQLHGSGCTVEPDGAFRCPPAEFTQVMAGDGNDRVSLDGSIRNASASGEDGDDVLTGNSLFGGPGADELTAAGGDALLSGDGGRDVVHGGPGDDQIFDETEAPKADILEGGPGFDTLAFAAPSSVQRKRAVMVDLRPSAQLGGSAGEGNQLSGFEQATGGAGDDTIIGPAAIVGAGRRVALLGGTGDDRLIAGGPVRTYLFGGPGSDRLTGGAAADTLNGGFPTPGYGRDHDRLTGGAGDDRLTGGAGRDVLDGGPGRDRLDGEIGRDRLLGGLGRDSLKSRDGERDRVDGGPGRDRAVVDRRDRSRRCERVTGARSLPGRGLT